MHGEPCLGRNTSEKLPPPYLCELCQKNPVPYGHVRAGSPVARMCTDCEKIVGEWERRKKEHRALLSKIFAERKIDGR